MVDVLTLELRSFIGTAKLGTSNQQFPASATVGRDALIARLDKHRRDFDRLGLLWAAMVVVCFIFVLVTSVEQVVRPELGITGGGVVIGGLLWRIERIWRERERFSIALEIALHEPDTEALRHLMIRIFDSLVSTRSKNRKMQKGSR